MPVHLRNCVGDTSMIVRGPGAGGIVKIEAYELLDPFHWSGIRQGGYFTFEGGLPDSAGARAIDDLLEPLRPDPEEDGADLFAPVDEPAALRRD
jgi:hypothetical protein